MPVPVIVPKCTLSMEEATILQWLKAEGDRVSKDDVLFEMETDKAVMEVPADQDGVLLEILTREGPVKLEQIVGWMRVEGEPVGTGKSDSARAFATPAARRRARELELNLSSVAPRAPGERITQEDVERAWESLSRVEPPTKLAASTDRRALIQRLSATWRSVPHIHIAALTDAAGLVHARDTAKLRHGSGISVTDLLLFVLARLLPTFPELTGVWGGDDLKSSSEINLAFAVDTSHGVVAPVISRAASLRLKELSETRRLLADAARNRRLKADDLQGGVFTLTNLGMQGVDFFAPLVNTPQTAILATGRVTEQPAVVDSQLTVGWRMWANLALDHRAADGMVAARFLERFQAEIARLSGTLNKD